MVCSRTRTTREDNGIGVLARERRIVIYEADADRTSGTKTTTKQNMGWTWCFWPQTLRLRSPLLRENSTPKLEPMKESVSLTGSICLGPAC